MNANYYVLLCSYLKVILHFVFNRWENMFNRLNAKEILLCLFLNGIFVFLIDFFYKKRNEGKELLKHCLILFLKKKK